MQVLPTAFVVARDLKRLQQIVTVLLRFGFGDLVRRLGLHRLRLAIEALGPTFVKLGQILATRSDLLSAEWLAELEKLHDRVPPLPYGALAPVLEAALGGPPDAIFARFDRVPLASASIAQVHRAALADGTEVVVKIRRPGLRPLVEADLRLLAHAARLAETELPELRRYHPEAITRTLSAAIGAARIAVAIVTAAFVVGLAPILAETGPRLFGIPAFALLGCLAALAGIAWLLVTGRGD
ncbi:ABC1 kinase family protein [Inquilinus sp. OTU3971]|uniref:ABC1 kinase family protein n=1 Tax=Inquilinus sp. OTU3971 TaxID=3043855 RepID=UPI00313B1DB2